MIIRKPYAFLIKNFRLIHFFMLLISGYILYRTSIALSFFNDYVSTRQFIESETLIRDTVPLIIGFAAFLLIVASVFIIVLFRKKNKPMLFYIITIISYMALLFIMIITRGILTTIIIDGIDPRIARIVRDAWLIAFIIQIVLVGFYLIRTLGFDIKKFNFGEDIHELKIEDEDSEEFELTARFNADRAKMRAAMRKEELKSFFYENKFMIIIILILLFVVIPGAFITKTIIANKKYVENEIIDLNNFELKVTESYLTKKNYKGESKLKNENSFLVVKFNINNLEEKERGVKLNNLRIEANGNIYTPNTTYYDSFKDLGKGYTGQTITKKNKDYIVVYVVKDEDMKDNIMLRYTDRITVKNEETSALYYRVILEPKKIDEDLKTTNLELGQELKITGTSLKIIYMNLKDKFTYEVSDKTKYIVNSTGLVLSLSYEYASSDNELKTIGDFLKVYGSIEYKVGDKTYTDKINDITPNNYANKEIFLGVNERIKDAENIDLVVNLRKVKYVYKIK